MDIMCPHLDVDKNATMFRIFRVYKKKDFDNCHVISQSDVPKEVNSKMTYHCNHPDRENKLTFKMQRFSPSPFGFTFKYCQDYYYVALPEGQLNMDSCGPTTTKLKISVGCRETTTDKSATTTTV